MSGLCLLHCLLLPALLVLVPSLGAWFMLPDSFHIWAVVIAVPTSIVSLVLGRRRHHRWAPTLLALPGLLGLIASVALATGLVMETAVTVAGAFLLAAAHLLNMRHANAVAA